MSQLPVVIALACVFAFAAPGAAQAPPPKPETPEALARSAVETLMRALAAALAQFPSYAMPEINERGDIIIRRLDPPAPARPRPAPPSREGETRT
jgi:hypothetical protein